MAGTQVQLRRGTTTQHSTFTGAEGEVTVDTTKDTLVVHDGATVGGHPLAKASDIGALAAQGDGDKGDITVSSSGGTWTIDNNAVTYAKMQDVSATARVLGRKTSGSGDPEECTLSEVLDFIGSAAQGDILYRGASSWARLAAGTNGHYLQTQGASANPQWAAVSAGLVSLGSVTTATNVNSVSITGLTLTSYKQLYIIVNDISSKSSGRLLYITSDNTQAGGGFNFASTTAHYGGAVLDLATGILFGTVQVGTAATSTASVNVGGVSNISTSSTQVSFRIASTTEFNSTGTFYLFGVR